MGQTRKLRILISLLKDKTSIIKSTTKRHSKIHIAVLRATSHNSSSPPPDHRISTVLSRSNISSHDAASTCIEALMDRLHSTKNASVALKCLFTLHIILTKGSFVLKDQLSIYPSCGGRNSLNLSNFRGEPGSETWELSSWVRWYATVIEQNLTVSRFLGHYLSSCSSSTSINSDLLSETEVLVNFVEVINRVPDSLSLQRNNLIYEIVRLVSEDYRNAQREIFIRVQELGERVPGLGLSELTQIVGNLNRFESFKERLSLLFVNRNRNDALWELVSKIKLKTQDMMNERGKIKLLEMHSTNGSTQLTRLGQRGFADVDNLNWARF